MLLNLDSETKNTLSAIASKHGVSPQVIAEQVLKQYTDQVAPVTALTTDSGGSNFYMDNQEQNLDEALRAKQDTARLLMVARIRSDRADSGLTPEAAREKMIERISKRV